MLNESDGGGTTGYAWDLENRLRSVTLPGGEVVEFKYDPFGRRICKTSLSGTTIFVYDGVNVIEEVDAEGSLVARYTQSLGVDEPLAMRRGSQIAYYQTDGLGSVSSLTDSQGNMAATYEYDSFGNLTSSTGSMINPFRYTGREFDAETGLYFYRARYYDSSSGRFISEDPAGFVAGVNAYIYVQNNPINLIDPLGLRPLTDCEKNTLGPYIPQVDLDNADLHDGEVPWYLGSEFDGITRGNDIYFRPGVYNANTSAGLALLGHELVHVGQYRNGMNALSYIWSTRNGYMNSKYEKPAYALQSQIQKDLTNSGFGGCECQ